MSSGSSPRMRGAHELAFRLPDMGRIIPADAGSTRGGSCRVDECWDHPRGCGEHSPSIGAIMSRSGSSPRMRGARPRSPGANSRGRIIPADAGSTFPASSFVRKVSDHPRGCGEHLYLILKWVGLAGSSPRMRGARCSAGCAGPAGRIIPADAGSTQTVLWNPTGHKDHPRGCGEHATSAHLHSS